jgi:hypothetical protein
MFVIDKLAMPSYQLRRSFLEVTIGLVDAGLVPQQFAQGGYDQRLDLICDVPKGKVLWWFDLADMARANMREAQAMDLAQRCDLWMGTILR